jgi:glycosyltransferase involved in cell wall biosynthesis
MTNPCSMTNPGPIVSVVIPTRNRPLLAARAVRSALAQTFADLEIVVVVDGADSDTVPGLSAIHDARVRFVELPRSVGGSEARNVGVRNARGEWIAFLDDDDEWFPDKTEKQLKLASASSHTFPIVSCRLIGRSPHAEYIWPRRLPAAPLSEYLMGRSSVFQGEGLMQTSTLLARRTMLLATPFTAGLRKHQDWDWVLRAASTEGAGIEFVPEPLAVWYVEEARPSIAKDDDWRYSLDWADRLAGLITPRAYAGFALTFLSMSAAKRGEWAAFWPLLRAAFRKGKPRPIHLLLYLGMWLTPQHLRRRVRALFSGARRGEMPAGTTVTTAS